MKGNSMKTDTSKNALLGIDKIEWSKEDWMDLYLTLEDFKKRLLERHNSNEPQSTDRGLSF